jgi:glycerophosphoryl diester phosphodiesterase
MIHFMERPLVIAHRGASARAPENSLAALRLARELGADAVEFDVHATADGVLVVHHDEMIGRHHIAHCSLAEVREHVLPNGEPVPTLQEALESVLPHLTAFVEVKAMAQKWDRVLFEILDATPSPERVAIHSFDHRIVHRIGEERPHLHRGVLSASYPVYPARVMEDADADSLWQHATLVDHALVEKVHDSGGRLYAWTVDDPEQMTRLLEMGVDGLCTNHPDRGRQAVDSLPS